MMMIKMNNIPSRWLHSSSTCNGTVTEFFNVTVATEI